MSATIVLSMAVGDAWRELGEYTHAAKAKWAKENGCIAVTHYWNDELAVTLERPASWYKLGLILSELFVGRNVIWMDADAIPYPCLKRRMIEPMNSDTMVISKNHIGVNCGLFGLLCGQESLAMVDKWWNWPSDHFHPWWENKALMEMIEKRACCVSISTIPHDANLLHAAGVPGGPSAKLAWLKQRAKWLEAK